MEIRPMTLCFIHQGSNILLGMKKRGFGEGKWNGFGGKIHEHESVNEAARREVEEECGVSVGKFEKRGLLHFSFIDNNDYKLEVHVFRADDYSGLVRETEEMIPKWFKVESLPYDSMWPDDKYWMPLYINKKLFIGHFMFGDQGDIVDYSLEEVTRLK